MKLAINNFVSSVVALRQAKSLNFIPLSKANAVSIVSASVAAEL